MPAGSSTGPSEVAPWQDEYREESHDAQAAIDGLVMHASRLLDTLKSMTSEPVPSSSQDNNPLLPRLRTIDTLSTDFDQCIQEHTLALHKLRCQAFTACARHAPISRLPDDILATIFECLADPLVKSRRSLWYMRGARYVEHSNRPTQITVAAVCSKWRRIAHKSPALWSQIIFDADLPNETMEEWCQRGADQPLDLVLMLMDCQDGADSFRIQLLNRVSHRLRSLHVVGHNIALSRLAHQWLEPAPQLEEYEVTEQNECYCSDVASPSEPGTYIRAASSLPALRLFTIKPMFFPFFPLPALDGCFSETLQELYLNFSRGSITDLAAFLCLLAGVPNMRILHLRNVSFCDQVHEDCPTIKDHEPVFMGCLHTLHIYTHHRYYHQSNLCSKWLQLLDAPELHTVDVNGSSRWQQELNYGCELCPAVEEGILDPVLLLEEGTDNEEEDWDQY